MRKSDQSIVQVGKIVGLYGVRGWVKVQSFTSPRENILGFSPWYLRGADGWRAETEFEGRRHGKGVIARIGQIHDRDAAAALVNLDIGIRREQLPALEAGEYYWTDLEGLRVSTSGGRALGVIDHLIETGANDVLVVRDEDRERLIPYIPDVVKRIDLGAGTMEVDWDPEF